MDTFSVGVSVSTCLAVGLIFMLTKLYFSFKYFTARKIPFDQPSMSLAAMPFLLWEMYQKAEDHKLFGFFILWKPNFLIKDPELIKDILVKNFSSFHDRGFYHNEKREPLTAHLFALEGEKWRTLRSKLSPAFTSGRMKMMFPTFTMFADRLITYISEHPSDQPLECYDLAAKFTLSNIASVAFGIESDLFNESSTFLKMAQKFNAPSFEQIIRSFLFFHLESLAKYMPFKLIPQDVSSFFCHVADEAVAFREQNDVVKDDILQMLIELKNKGFIAGVSDWDGSHLTLDQLHAQAFVFLLAGFETSAYAQSWVLYELATHPDIQRRLQAELDTVDSWTYESVMKLQYLDMVLSETLRKYPTVPFIVRKCNEDYSVAGSDVVIKKGSNINMSVLGLHRDPKLFPDPDKFDPERFGPNPPHEILPYSYLPFGDGPRFCIGMRFAKAQSKVGLASLMKHYTVEPSERLRVPASLHRKSVQVMAEHGVWLTFKKRVK